MDKNRLKHNIFIFGIYRFISRFYLYLSILVIVLYNYGLTYIQISYIVATHGLVIMIFKTPIAYLVNKISYKKILIFSGEIFKSLGVLGLALSQNHFVLLIISQAISGIGFSLTMSIESGLILDSLKSEGVENEYRKIEAKTQSYCFISAFLSGVAGSIIAAQYIRLPLFLTAPFCVLAAVSILFFKEAKSENSKKAVDKNNRKLKPKKKGFTIEIFSVLLYYAFNRAIILTTFVFVFPIYLFKISEIDLLFFGVILGLFSISAFFVSQNFQKISLKLSEKTLWIIPPVCLLAVVLILISETMLLILIPILLGISTAIVRPLAMGKINSTIKENNSAVMSKGEQMFGFLNALFIIIIGYIFNSNGIIFSLYIYGIIMIAINILLCTAFNINKKVKK